MEAMISPLFEGFGFTHWDGPPGADPVEATAEERRRTRRKESNRESARRSRMRKRRRMEELGEQAEALRAENRDLAARVGATAHCCLLVRRDNERLMAESECLRSRLDELRRVLDLRMQLQGLLVLGNDQALIA